MKNMALRRTSQERELEEMLKDKIISSKCKSLKSAQKAWQNYKNFLLKLLIIGRYAHHQSPF
jgi:hypothetical protein